MKKTADIIRVCEDKLQKAQSNLDNIHIKRMHSRIEHTFSSGWDQGYWEGRVSALRSMLNTLKEME